MSHQEPKFETQIWEEEAHPDNPFQADRAFCHGYDVYGEVLGKASYSAYILLLFLGERPRLEQIKLLDLIGVAIANSGPRDPAIRAAMNSGVGGAPVAANLISALAVGAGNLGGSREVFQLVHWFTKYGLHQSKWKSLASDPNQDRKREDIWEPYEHFPGINPHSQQTTKPVKQFIKQASLIDPHELWDWFHEIHVDLEDIASGSISLNFVVAIAFYRLGFSASQAEICHLLMRLPGAAVHALEANHQGWRKFPFFGGKLELLDDPGEVAPLPDVSEFLK